MKSGIIAYVRRKIRMSEMKEFKPLEDKPEKKRILCRTGHRFQDNITMDVKESGLGSQESVRKAGTRIPVELRNALFSIFIQTGNRNLATSH